MGNIYADAGGGVWLSVKMWLAGAGLNILYAMAILVAGLFAAKYITKLFRKIMGKTALDVSLIDFIASACRILLVILVLITVLGQLGIPTTSIITALASAGVALSLALKDSLSNIAGSISILVGKPFVTGDAVEIDGRAMAVGKIDYFYTVFDTFDNNQVIIPNGQLVNKTVLNFTREDIRRADFPIGVAYSADMDAAKSALVSAAKTNAYVIDEPAPCAGVTGCADSSVTVTLRVWCRSKDYAALSFSLPEAMKRALDAANIEIPYNKLDVYVKEGAVV